MNGISKFVLHAVSNFLFGSVFQYMFVLFVILFLYVSEALGYTLDPTLEKGLLIPFLFITAAAGFVYFSAVILTNMYYRKKIKLKKTHFLLLTFLFFSSGVFANGERIATFFN
ncbi:hypothetical protein [Metabacillus sp. JX24]|uniref:hypothetical protein n=1 Tax=Metabacillus sp. JX24 TaxID=3240759 RepID=UPI00350EBB5C